MSANQVLHFKREISTTKPKRSFVYRSWMSGNAVTQPCRHLGATSWQLLKAKKLHLYCDNGLKLPWISTVCKPQSNKTTGSHPFWFVLWLWENQTTLSSWTSSTDCYSKCVTLLSTRKLCPQSVLLPFRIMAALTPAMRHVIDLA